MKYCITIITTLIIGMLTAFSGSIKPLEKESLQGIWVQEGYGRIIEITKKKIHVYDVSKVSCIPNISLPLKYMEYIGKVSHHDKTSLTISGGINHMDFKRADAMPDICNGYGERDLKDRVHNFESIWHTFNEQYCAFEKRKINWQDIYEKYRSQITSSMSEVDLYITIENMLDELKDGHVGIYLPNKLEKAYELKKNPKRANNNPPAQSNTQLKVAARKSILSQYVGDYQEYNKGVLRWGMMDGNIAYLQINAMERWADFGISDELSNREFWKAYLKKQDKLIDAVNVNLDGVNAILDKIIDESNDAKAYVLDIRFNGGGSDEIALAIMNHFAAEAVPVFTKKGRLEDGYTRTLTARVTPARKRFTGKVYVLTSVETASAAEIMSLAAREMPNVTLIGSATEGIFSDILEKKLPIGWEYGLSNEVYETMDGQDYESKGVPPNHEVPYRRWTRGFLEDITEDLKDGDNAVDLVFKLNH